jgi:superfamily II DNA or RNA helicase
LQHGRGTIVIPTGGGKSRLGAAIIASIDQPTLWLTHREILLYQTQEALSSILKRKVGIVGDGHMDVKLVTVAMVQSLKNSDNPKYDSLREFLENVKVVIGDEIHHLASSSDLWYKNLVKIPAPWRFGLTATPEFEGPGLKVIGQTGGEIFRITTQELIDRGVLVPPRIWIDEISEPTIPVKTDWRTVYKKGIVENYYRNRRIVSAAKQWSVVEDKPTVILVRQIAHGDTLTSMLRGEGVECDFIHGEVPGAQRDLVLAGLKSRLVKCLVAQVEILGEGVDLPWLRAAVNATGVRGGGDASEGGEGQTGRQVIQVLGRILRNAPGKKHADILDFCDLTHKRLKDASSDRLGSYLSQGHESRIARLRDYDDNEP